MSPSLTFSVRRREPVLVPPAEPTPHEFKPLSAIDDQESFRHQTPTLHFFEHSPSMAGIDPAQVIREALAKLLVFYYPFAGRIRDAPQRKLIVETTGEGVLFVEADADVSLRQFGDLQPPFPCSEELLFDVPGSGNVVGAPLLLIQVTRLTCGGFVLGLRMNHTMCDGAGIGQFMVALGQLARGSLEPAPPPVWERELLDSRDPPGPTFRHREYEEGTTSVPLARMTEQCFFFGARETAALRDRLPEHLRGCGRYELLAACLWKVRTAALGVPEDEEVKLVCVVNARSRYSPPLPAGFYGNAIGLPAVVTAAGALRRAELGKVVEMVKEAISRVTDEYMRSTADVIAMKGRPPVSTVGTYHISDLTGHGFGEVDFGWGRPVYGGIARVGMCPGVASFYISGRRGEEEGVIVPAVLPVQAMERFLTELRRLTSAAAGQQNGSEEGEQLVTTGGKGLTCPM